MKTTEEKSYQHTAPCVQHEFVLRSTRKIEWVILAFRFFLSLLSFACDVFAHTIKAVFDLYVRAYILFTLRHVFVVLLFFLMRSCTNCKYIYYNLKLSHIVEMLFFFVGFAWQQHRVRDEHAGTERERKTIIILLVLFDYIILSSFLVLRDLSSFFSFAEFVSLYWLVVCAIAWGPCNFCVCNIFSPLLLLPIIFFV